MCLINERRSATHDTGILNENMKVIPVVVYLYNMLVMFFFFERLEVIMQFSSINLNIKRVHLL